jgi:cytochrome c-type biogenesis protein CcmF
MKPGETAEIGGYGLTLQSFRTSSAGDYDQTSVIFSVARGGHQVATLAPAKRVYADRQTTTTEAAIRTTGFSQLYLSLGDIAADGTTTVRVYWKPLVTMIWLGAVVMAFGGLMSLSDRRLRVGAPKPARRIQPQPAE